ncbi:type I polyketide synthase, partial [Streptomyces lavendulae]|uniref:type I polyketide synthase n=1 Tax=Streptomyces lavendulae TaxID=1914 RepID=UPI0036E12189
MHESDSTKSPTVPEPIAVIGMSCRLAQVKDPRAFWHMLREQRHGITSVPEDRWGPWADDLAQTGARLGGFVDDVDHFDASFFGISPREAEMMDPQQRLTLELGWEALEDARLTPAALGRNRTGVFVGAISGDHAALVLRGGPALITQHTMTGVERGLIANRLSYHLDLHGPSMTVDAAQASSLVAVHVAVESLRSGECDVALAGGVHLNLSPESALAAARFGGLSPDGRSYTFDARANGFVRGEGGGLVLLKPLSRALEDGDHVYCVIRGSAVNNDGASEGLTRPDTDAQEEVLRHAYRRAGVDPSTVAYVELHGTGTPLGDPIEAAALGAAFGPAEQREGPLLVGSAKTNVGHLEGAAGITGLIKAALSIEHGELPASLNFEQPNPEIPFTELNLRVVREATAWPSSEGPRRAGVSAFGMGGTNCHVVLEQAPASTEAENDPAPVQEDPAPPVIPLLVSARDTDALGELATRLTDLTDHLPQDRDLTDLATALTTTRTLFEHRAVALTTDPTHATHTLTALANHQPH